MLVLFTYVHAIDIRIRLSQLFMAFNLKEGAVEDSDEERRRWSIDHSVCIRYAPMAYCIHIYVYIYVCICMYMYIYVCICIYMYIYICMYMYIYVYIYMYVCVCMYIYTVEDSDEELRRGSIDYSVCACIIHIIHMIHKYTYLSLSMYVYVFINVYDYMYMYEFILLYVYT